MMATKTLNLPGWGEIWDFIFSADIGYNHEIANFLINKTTILLQSLGKFWRGEVFYHYSEDFSNVFYF